MMTSSQEASGTYIGNKENSDQKEFDGIEANDLATLLLRFEEATSSDDISVPCPVNKTQWNIMKAKSAGCSPAVTPPATPPPMGQRKLKSFTKASPVSIGGQNWPIQLSVINPVSPQQTTQPSLATSTHLGITKLCTNSSIPAQPQMNIRISNADPSTKSLLVNSANKQSLLPKFSQLPVSLLGNSFNVVKKASGAGGFKTGKSSASTTAPKHQVIKMPFPSDSETVCVQPCSSSDTVATPKTFNILRMPALDAATSFNVESSSKQIIPKKRTSLLPNAFEVGKRRKMKNSSSDIPIVSTSCSLVSSQLNQPTPISASTTSNVLELPPLRLVSTDVKGSDKNLVADSTKEIKASKISRLQVQKDEHTYCWTGPCFNNKNISRIGVSALSKDSSLATSKEEASLDPLFKELKNDACSEEVVVEECEIFVDSNGNDIFTKGASKQKPEAKHSENDISNRVVCFDTGDSTGNRRNRKYRRPGELRNSPVREDKTDFYDKIPSYYTALSIPSQQIKKSVFESVSSTLGSQDHFALSSNFDLKEDAEDEGQYNKVPFHHRVFTNTSQDVKLPDEIEPSSSVFEDREEGRSSRSRRASTTSRHSVHSTSSQRSNRSGSRQSYGDRPSRSRSHSPFDSDNSQAPSRSRPLVRRRNSSQHSDVSCSSSCSSNSYCSTCGASLSRSRSRSYSSDRSCTPDSRYSRSRSRSPRRRRRISSRSSTPDNSRRRWASRSRSPRRRRTSYNASSRSRRHQMKERSSAERKIMEIRKQREDDKVKAMEERRVLYVGKLPENYTKHQLRKRFECFGEIQGVRLNFRVHGDNYGFVTFSYACDAFAAKEKGNSNPDLPRFDLCFGGRRRFCPDKYADLDGNRELEEEYAPLQSAHSSGDLDYAALLKQHVSDQRKRKR